MIELVLDDGLVRALADVGFARDAVAFNGDELELLRRERLRFRGFRLISADAPASPQLAPGT